MTTLAVARDLAARMDYRLGFVLYDLEGTATRCGLSTATVKRHVRVLRELGALAWRRHGTKKNLRLPGRPYTATATIYAAVIPAVVDTGRDKQPAGQRGSARRAPHSPGPRPLVPTADTSGEINYTPRRRARRHNSGSSLRSPWQVAQDISIARQVRPLVGWTQGEGLRRLAFALRPLIDRGLAAHDVAAELIGLAVDWRPARPAAYITAALARDKQAETARRAGEEHTADPADHQEWQQWLKSREPDVPGRGDSDRRHARLYAWDQWREVAAHYDEDPDDALDLYGTRLCAYAVRRSGLPIR
ncbi:hypothetical protein [Streptomyces sp. NPDC048565]|uniref:hypothetical protein n=1 Tax=Streptomyces sp. NPDC048565 TaxID=3155266 RepID=UPI00343F65E9